MVFGPWRSHGEVISRCTSSNKQEVEESRTAFLFQILPLRYLINRNRHRNCLRMRVAWCDNYFIMTACNEGVFEGGYEGPQTPQGAFSASEGAC